MTVEPERSYRTGASISDAAGLRQLVNKRDYAMLMHGIDNDGNWIHVKAPGANFDAADLERYAQIKKR